MGRRDATASGLHRLRHSNVNLWLGRIETHEQDVDELDRAICRRSTTRSLVTLGDEAGTFGREQIAGDLHRLTSSS